MWFLRARFPESAELAKKTSCGRTMVAGFMHCRRGQPLCKTFIGGQMKNILRKLWLEDEGQDIAEYAVMLAVILVIVVGTIRLIGSNANNVFSSVASSIQ
jgi:Flp pilus assembly pilin Flp